MRQPDLDTVIADLRERAQRAREATERAEERLRKMGYVRKPQSKAGQVIGSLLALALFLMACAAVLGALGVLLAAARWIAGG